jgi:Big-like domain-containing protein
VALTQPLQADSTWVYAVQISASVQTSPAAIALSWQPDQYGANSYELYRKGKNAGSWNHLATLPGSASTYVDYGVSVGAAYEYQIVKAATLGYTGFGYIYAGIQVPLDEKRGKVVLVVDSSVAGALSSELNRLRNDLVGDGWAVVRRDVGRSDSPANVRNIIISEYNADPGNVNAVFLFGHVPIYRSGSLNVDGHQARPMPADGVYGDVDGGWGGNSYLPSDVELMVGRVDLWNMPVGGASEVELLRNYLNKDHRWRHKQVTVPQRALVGDRFGDMSGESFAASGYRNFNPFVGHNATDIANEKDGAPADQRWSSMLVGGSYLWAYGCGGGSYVSMSGMGTHGTYADVISADIVGGDAKAVFFMMMGSWLGEWDATDNIMRAALATPSLGLTCSWAGRPHWFYHHMALGEPIGFSARLSMNNNGLYRNQVNQFARGVHIALMGDPTLRAHQIAPVSNLTGGGDAGNVRLTWSASPDGLGGYHVYRAGAMNGNFARLNGSLINGTAFTDTSAASGNTYVYMVRAVKMQNTASGSYVNASQGIFETVTVGGPPPPPPPPPDDSVPPSVAVTSPAPSATVSGANVLLSANASDNVRVAGVQFRVDGVNVGPEIWVPPYELRWDSTKVAAGEHRITAVARDPAGNRTVGAVTVYVVNSGSGTKIDVVWIEDSLPPGAEAYAERETWKWVNTRKYTGKLAHKSAVTNRLHQHYFDNATATLNVGAGDILYTWVYLDPKYMPRQIMLQWSDGSWEHRAYWGQNMIAYGTPGTPSRVYMGALPPAGRWVRLKVPASAVGLEGRSIKGMAFSLQAGTAWWDRSGKLVPK